MSQLIDFIILSDLGGVIPRIKRAKKSRHSNEFDMICRLKYTIPNRRPEDKANETGFASGSF
jgi:hypothetical protein